jgi:hypothetical protein
MAAKKTTTRKGAGKNRTLDDVRKIAKKARDEVARLLADEQAGTITRKQLTTGLEEVERNLERIMIFHFKL